MRVALVAATLFAATLFAATLMLLAIRAGASPAARVATLRADGIATVPFGVTKQRAVAELTTLFGAPSARGINTGCGPRYTEVAWGDLAAEFRSNSFSGYRYLVGGYRFSTSGVAPHSAKAVAPRLETAKGISLGSTLAQLRAAYGTLRFIGTDRWQSTNGLVFVDNAEHDPAPATSRLIEIKTGTCGDF